MKGSEVLLLLVLPAGAKWEELAATGTLQSQIERRRRRDVEDEKQAWKKKTPNAAKIRSGVFNLLTEVTKPVLKTHRVLA